MKKINLLTKTFFIWEMSNNLFFTILMGAVVLLHFQKGQYVVGLVSAIAVCVAFIFAIAAFGIVDGKKWGESFWSWLLLSKQWKGAIP